jgi:SH3-like domain-containing protein
VAAKPLKPSYVGRLPEAKADALNIAKAVPVKPTTVNIPVSVVQPPAQVVAELTVEAAPSYTHQVIASGANVRTGPKKSFPQVFTLRQGSWVNISENVRGWVKVTDETGREGWVYGDLLQQAATTVATAE